MRHNAHAWAVTMIGAVIGGLTGYMLFTDEGRAWRRQLEPQIEDLMREIDQFRGTVARASSAAGESWRMLHEALGEHSAQHVTPESGPYGRSSQSHPF